jgi:hypothetical protein
MKKNLTTILLTTAVISTGCLFFTHGSHEQHWKDQEQARVLQSGVATCGQRLMQSFNAWSGLQNTSNFLSESFRADTEACFAEAMQITREANALKSLESGLNSLISEVHYLNTNMVLADMAKLTTGIAGAREDIVDKYNRYEEGVERIQNELDAIANSAQSAAANSKLAAILFSTFSFLSLIAVFANEQKRKKNKNAIEAQALDLMTNQLDAQSQQAQAIIEAALDLADLEQTKLLLRLNVQSTYSEASQSIDESVSVPNLQREKNVEADITSDFSQVFSDVYENMSSKIFAQGIVCDMDLEAQTQVRSNSEDLIQLVHASMNFAIKKLNPEHRKLSIKTKKVADILFYRIHIPNMCFNANEMEMNQGKLSDVAVELQLLAATAEGLNASLQLKNRFSTQSNEMAECIIEMTLKTASAEEKASNRELTQLVKMSKRELGEKLKKELQFNA